MLKNIAIFFMMLVFFACKKDHRLGEDQYIALTYKQTSCSDPWQNAGTDSLTLVNVTKYLQDAGLYAASIQIKSGGEQEVCNACFCKTGKLIVVSTLNSEPIKEKYREIGFI